MLTPREIAQVYDLHASAVWRGEESPSLFANWLAGHWMPNPPAEPELPPDAVSFLGGAGLGIRWYAQDEVLVGYVAGRPRGSYLISIDDSPPIPPVPGINTFAANEWSDLAGRAR